MESRHPVLRQAEQAVDAPQGAETTDTGGTVLAWKPTVHAYRIVNAVRRANETKTAFVSEPHSWQAGGVCLVIFFLAAGVTFGLVCVRALRTIRTAPSLQSFVGPPQTDNAHESPGLHIEPANGRLLITWNQAAAVVRNASRGQLRIDDGDRHQTLNLDENQIHTGAISYRALTGDINVEISFSDQAGGSRMESYRILDDALGGRRTRSLPSQENREQTTVNAEGKGIETRRWTAELPAVQSPSSNAVPKGEQTSVPSAAVSRAQAMPPSTSADGPLPSARTNADGAPQQENTTQPAVSQESADTGAGKNANDVAIGPSPIGTAAPLPAQALPSQVEPSGPEPSGPKIALFPTAGTLARPLMMVNPNAASLRAAHISSPCELRLYADIDETGRVIAARPLAIDRAIGPEMIVASVAAARQWKFAPARSSAGLPIKSHYSIVFRFQPTH